MRAIFRAAQAQVAVTASAAGAVANTVLSTSQVQALGLTPSVLPLTPRRWQAAPCRFPRQGVGAERGGDWLRGTVPLTHSPCQDEDGEASATVLDTRGRTWTPNGPTGCRAAPTSRDDQRWERGMLRGCREGAARLSAWGVWGGEKAPLLPEPRGRRWEGG